jgi:FAD/FMN-containing dehydrogenase
MSPVLPAPVIPWDSLKNALEGNLSLEKTEREQHSEDASMFREEPLALAFPKNRLDCEKILLFCRTHGISVHAWGAGTSRGGQPLGRGLVVNFRRYMNGILAYNEATGELTVQPGAYYSEVQKYLRARGRSFPPDPSYHQCTIGGMIANNSAGIRSVKYGATIDHIQGVGFLTSDGAYHSSDDPGELHARVRAFLAEARSTVESDYPRVEKNSAGYSLDRALTAEGRADLPKLLTGSEGTLALLTEARLGTVPLPAAPALALLYFTALESALAAAMNLRMCEISACELVDKVLLDLHGASHQAHPRHARRIVASNPFLERFYLLGAEAVLIVETEGEDAACAARLLTEALEALRSRPAALHLATSEEESARIWDLRRHTSPILNRLENGRITIKPLWGVEDVSLPRDTFLAYVREQKEIFARFGLTCSFFGHAASCNLHIDPLAVDPRRARVDADLARLYDEVAEESYDLVIRMGGSISGEHGDGLARTKFLPRQYPKSYPLFARLKTIFDPCGILNPGKIVMEHDLI